jgi:AraC family transcriptional regulator of adaptative response/methylated-DNA-[protein]-cysteine methyltransferase
MKTSVTLIQDGEAENPLLGAMTDYDKVRRALAFIFDTWRDQPSLDAVADHVDLSTAHLNHLFRRWAGLSPKAFLQAITIDHARRLLRDSASILDASLDLGLSGPARLHDLFVTHEAMSPGDWKAGGAWLTLHYGFHPSPFGEAIIVIENNAFTAPFAARAFTPDLWRTDAPLKVILIGSDFEISVWKALLHVPFGAATTYSDIASQVGKPKAARAVGAAIGRNPISFVVPCHRIIGKSGALTGYHWGLTRKRAILGWEAGQISGPDS